MLVRIPAASLLKAPMLASSRAKSASKLMLELDGAVLGQTNWQLGPVRPTELPLGHIYASIVHTVPPEEGGGVVVFCGVPQYTMRRARVLAPTMPQPVELASPLATMPSLACQLLRAASVMVPK